MRAWAPVSFILFSLQGWFAGRMATKKPPAKARGEAHARRDGVRYVTSTTTAKSRVLFTTPIVPQLGSPTKHLIGEECERLNLVMGTEISSATAYLLATQRRPVERARPAGQSSDHEIASMRSAPATQGAQGSANSSVQASEFAGVKRVRLSSGVKSTPPQSLVGEQVPEPRDALLVH